MTFPARVVVWKGEKLQFDGTDPRLATREQAEAARAHVEDAALTVVKVEAKERKGSSPPPFTTSKLQQGAARVGFCVRRTMKIAQRLYEGQAIGDSGTVGLITYMRTDSTRTADEALVAVREYIGRTYGETPSPTRRGATVRRRTPRTRTRRSARRRSTCRRRPSPATWLPDELKLYRLIWNRFVASQMTPSVSDVTTVEIEARQGRRRPRDCAPPARCSRTRASCASTEGSRAGRGGQEHAGGRRRRGDDATRCACPPSPRATR